MSTSVHSTSYSTTGAIVMNIKFTWTPKQEFNFANWDVWLGYWDPQPSSGYYESQSNYVDFDFRNYILYGIVYQSFGIGMKTTKNIPKYNTMAM